MPHEEPIPPLDAILDGSGVRYYSKRTRQLTSLEKKLETAREAFHTARKEQGLPDQPKLFHSSGSLPSRPSTASNPPPASSAALRRELRRQALEMGGGASGGGGSGGSATADGATGAAGGGSTIHSRSRSGRDSDFQRFADSLVSSGRGPVVVAKPYHTEARTYFNLSLLPSCVTRLAGDSGLYYSPVATSRGAVGPAAKGLREDTKLRYYQPDLAMERERKEQAVQMEMAERLAKAQDALGEHIQALVGRWGPGFLERLTAAAAAEAAGEAGRNSRLSGASATPIGGAGGAAAGGRQSPLKLHLSAGGMNVKASAADALYEFEHYQKKAGGRPRRSSSPVPIGGTAARLYGIGDMRFSAASLERISYLSEQLKVPVEQIMTLMRKPASAGEGKTSPTATATKRPAVVSVIGRGGVGSGGGGNGGGGGGGGGNVMGVAGARQSRRVELPLARRPAPLVKRESLAAASTPSAAVAGEQGDELDAEVAAITSAVAASPAPPDKGRHSPFEATAAVAVSQAQGSGGTPDVFGGSTLAAAAAAEGGAGVPSGETSAVAAAAAAAGIRQEPTKGREKHRHIHLLVAAAVAERDAAEANAAALRAQQRHHQHRDAAQVGATTTRNSAAASGLTLSAAFVTGAATACPGSGDAAAAAAAAAATAAAEASGSGTQQQQVVTMEVPRTPVDGERQSLVAAAAATAPPPPPPSGAADASGTGGGEASVLPSLTDEQTGSPNRRLGSRVALVSPTMHQVWSAFPSRRARSRASPSTNSSPTTAASAATSAGPTPGLTLMDGDGDNAVLGSLPDSPVAYHHRSGVSYVALGDPMPAGPSLEGLQPVDPRQGELEAASRAALESLARRHGDSHRISRHFGRDTLALNATASRAGSASTASRPGTSGGFVERGGGNGACGGGGGQSQRRSRGRPTSRPSGTGMSRGGCGGSNGEQRRTTVGGMSAGRPDDGGWDSGGGGALRFSERGSGGDDDGGAGRGGGNDSSVRRRGGRMRSGGNRYSARSGGGSGGGGASSVRRRGNNSPSSVHSRSVAGTAAAMGAPGSSGEEVIFATGGGSSRQSPLRSGAGSHAGDVSGGGGGCAVVGQYGLRRLSDLAVAVGLNVTTNRSRRTSSPRSSASAGAMGTTGLLDSSDDDSLIGGEDRGREDEDMMPLGGGHVTDLWGGGGVDGGGRPNSRPSTSASANVGGGGGGPHLSWGIASAGGGAATSGKAMAAATAMRANTVLGAAVAVDGPLAGLAARIAASTQLQPPGQAARSSSSAAAANLVPPPPALAADAVLSASAGSSPSVVFPAGRSFIGRPDPCLSPPSLSRHYKLAGTRWNPTAPGALRPGYGIESDYVAGTYNPDLMERVAAAWDTAALTGAEVAVDYKSPVQAACARSVLPLPLSPPPPAAPLRHVAGGGGAAVAAGAPAAAATGTMLPASTRIALDLSMLTPAGRAAAAQVKAALAIADVLNPVTKALTNTAVLAAKNGSELPPPMQALAQARELDGTAAATSAAAPGSGSGGGGHTTVHLPAATITAATALAQHLVALPKSSRCKSPETIPSCHAAAGRRSGGDASASATAALRAAADFAEERVTSRTMRPSQSVWGRAELDELDILRPLTHHLAATIWAPAAGAAISPCSPWPTPAGATHAGAAAAAASAAATAAERRVVTAPEGLCAPAAAAAVPIPEPRLWRGNPLDLKSAFPKGEKVYRLVTDVQTNARLLREAEKDITPVEFRKRMRRGVVL